MNSDDIGDRGQWLFSLIMTELCGRDVPYFRPRFLDGKFPTFDFIVELVDRPEYFCFVQVKTTSLGYTRSTPPRLQVQVAQQDINRMAASPAPTYVVGIDLREKTGYVLSVNEPRERVASLTTSFPIDCSVLRAWANEVHDFWATRNMVLANSRFKE